MSESRTPNDDLGRARPETRAPSTPPPPRHDVDANVDVATLRRTHQVCTEFEAKWGTASPASIEALLVGVVGNERDLRLRWLIGSEIELRSELGENPEPHDYVRRFPHDSALIERVFQEDNSRAGDTLGPADGITAVPAAPAPGMPERIGDYELLGEIARGGMGVVYRARHRGLGRIVALKVILAGRLASDVDIARFHQETRAIAALEHPGVVPVYDVGEWSGYHYFSMPLMDGGNLAERIADRPLPARDAAEIMAAVAEAVAFAHRQGIVHRDLKPRNILLDRQGRPKVTDFGLAKFAASSLGTNDISMSFTGPTSSGQILGTPSYMAPEQAAGLKDMAYELCDVYSLGAVLYALTTGRPPFQAATPMETIRQVLDHEIVAPRRLNAQLPVDLETIALTSLSKAPAERYVSADALAHDLRQYLGGRPIAARPVPAWVHAWRWGKRQPLVAGLILAVLVSLGAGTVVASAFYWSARDQAARAMAAEQRASEETAIAVAVNEFLRNDLLAEASPERNARDQQVTVVELLGRAAKRIDGKFSKQPLIEAAIRETLGEAYLEMGDLSAAQPHLERALELRRRELGEEHVQTLSSMSGVARLYGNQAQFAKAEALWVIALEISNRVLGAEHPNTLTYGSNLAVVYQSQGQSQKAEPLWVKILEVRRRLLGEEDPQTLTVMTNLAGLYLALGRFTEAEPLCARALEIDCRLFGPEHPDSIVCRNNLGGIFHELGQLEKAEALKVENLEISRRVLGPDHPSLVSIINTLAMLYQDQDQLSKAEGLFEEALALSRRVLGDEHPVTLATLNYLGSLYQDQDEFAKAESLFIKNLESRRRVLGDEHPDTLVSIRNLAGLYDAQGKFGDAEGLYREFLEQTSKRDGPSSSRTAWAMLALGGTLFQQQKFADAEPPLLAGYEALQGPKGPSQAVDDPRLTRALEQLVRLYEATGQNEKAALHRQQLEARAR